MRPYETLRERLDDGQTVVLDGGIGSELVRRGVRWRQHGLRTDAAAVQALHSEYLLAGAQVIRTNTFQLNRRTYENVFRDADHMRHIGAPDLDQRIPVLIPKAVEIALAARQASGKPDVAIAGVMSPLEHCFRPDLAKCDDRARAEHAELARLLASAGVDLLLLESMNTISEAQLAVAAAQPTGLPIWVSFVVGGDGGLLGGGSLAEARRALQSYETVEAVLVNCAPPQTITRTLTVQGDRGAWTGGFAQIGRFDPPSWKFEFFPQFVGGDEWSPERYAVCAAGWRDLGARIVGGCCGTGPRHTRAIVERLQ